MTNAKRSTVESAERRAKSPPWAWVPLILLAALQAAGCRTSSEQPQDLPPETLAIPHGAAITADGVAGGSEWGDARRVEVAVPGRSGVEVFVKHDGVSLLFLFRFRLGDPGAAGALFPEVLIDPGNEGTETWLADDLWFHVSATDCDARGGPRNYANCSLIQPDWTAEPNFPVNPPGSVEWVEIIIPFAKAGLAPQRPFGLAVGVTDTHRVWEFWPPGTDPYRPSTWSGATLAW